MSLHVEFPSVGELYALYGERNMDWTFLRGYTDNTPMSVDDCVAMCRAGTWLPLVVKWGSQVWAFHHLHHMDPQGTDSTFVSGATAHVIRDKENQDLRRKAWKAAVRAIQAQWNYRSLHGYCVEDNEPGARWVLDDMECNYVGTMDDAVTQDGVSKAIVANTVRYGDIARCRERIKALFKNGVWRPEPTQLNPQGMPSDGLLAQEVDPYG